MSVKPTVTRNEMNVPERRCLFGGGDYMRKQQESELRKQRLQEVRAQARDLARKIRTDVAAEKERQLRRLENIKAQELSCWREHVLARRNHDYRTAIFEVGTAHRAAQQENESNRSKVAMRPNGNDNGSPCRPETYMAFRQKFRAEKLHKERAAKRKKSIKHHKASGTQTSDRGKEVQDAHTSMLKRKRPSCRGLCNCANCVCGSPLREDILDSDTEQPSDDNNNENNIDSDTLSSFSDDISALEEDDSSVSLMSECRCENDNKRNLSLTPTILLEVESDDNGDMPMPEVVNDKHHESNRHFSRIIDKGTKEEQKTTKATAPANLESAKDKKKRKATSASGVPEKALKKVTAVRKSATLRERNEPANVENARLSATATKKGLNKPQSKKTPAKSALKSTTAKSLQSKALEPRARKDKRIVCVENCPGPVSKRTSPRKKGQISAKKRRDSAENKQDDSKNDQSPAKKRQSGSPSKKKLSLTKTEQSPNKITQSPRKRTSSPSKKAKSSPEKGKKHFTSISDLLEKQKQREKECEFVEEPQELPPPPAPSPAITPPARLANNTPGIAPSATTFVIPGSQTDDNVQYYDYNNKFQKTYPQPEAQVEVHLPTSRGPNAMQQAAGEKELQDERQQQLEQMRQRSDARGQSAIQREQVRRDYVDLTEKLESLTRDAPVILPSDSNLLHPNRYSTAQARKEAKMSTAIEEMMARPAIITLPEVDQLPARPSSQGHHAKRAGNELNVAADPPQANNNNTVSSNDSCCSILLGYVNDQSKQLRSEIDQFRGQEQSSANDGEDRKTRLLNLLQRTEQMRDLLLSELRGTRSRPAAEDDANVQQQQQQQQQQQVKNVIDSISDLRRERESILEGRSRGNRDQREAILEQKIREFCEKEFGNTRKPKDSAESRTNEVKIVHADQENEKPIEIVIKVQSESNRTTRTERRTRSDLPEGRTQHTTAQQAQIQGQARDSNQAQSRSQRQSLQRAQSYPNSQSQLHMQASLYDLNKRLPNQPSKVVYDIPIEVQPSTASSVGSQLRQTSSTRTSVLNPLIAQYVQRLLGMTRDSVKNLEISSSDIDTPSSTIIEVPANQSVASEGTVTPDHLRQVEKFIEDNRSFIGELEESLKAHASSSLEANMRSFDEIWKNRFQTQAQGYKEDVRTAKNVPKPDAPSKSKSKARPPASAPAAATSKPQPKPGTRATTTTTTTTTSARRVVLAARAAQGQKAPAAAAPPAIPPSRGRTLSGSAELARPRTSNQKPVGPAKAPPSGRVPTQASTSSTEARKQPAAERPKSPVSRKMSAGPAKAQPASNQNQDQAPNQQQVEAQAQIERYEQLTENCTQRIAELTSLIQKVRVEKRRLVEVTLSSMSDTGRNYNTTDSQLISDEQTLSTQTTEEDEEQTDRRVGSKGTSTSTSSSSRMLDSNVLNGLESSSGEAVPEGAPLEKNKNTGRSQDSGISLSRPPTALSQPSQDAATIDSASSGTFPANLSRPKTKPPPTILRFSPLLVDEEYAHELSTIVEVETPATSRIVVNSARPETLRNNSATMETETRRTTAIKFPSFEQYARQMQLDLSLLDAEQSMRIEHDYNDLIESIKATAKSKRLNYEQFPNMATYLRNLNLPDSDQSSSSTENIDDLLACLRLADLNAQAFPSRREYMNGLRCNSPNDQQQQQQSNILDTASLERLSDNTTDNINNNTENDTETLNIEEELKRRNIMKQSFRYSTCEQTQRDAHTSINTHTAGMVAYMAATGAINGNEDYWTSESSGRLEQELQELGLSWPAAMQRKKKETDALSSDSSPLSQHQNNRGHNNSEADPAPFNLREFVARELEKHASSSSSSSASSQFIASIINSLTPTSSTPHKSNSRQRKRTSTPVNSISGTITATGTGTAPTNSEAFISSSTTTTQLFSGESRISSVRYSSPPLIYSEDVLETHYGKEKSGKRK